MSLCTVSISVNDKPQGSFYGGSTTVPVFTNPYGSPSCNCEARIAQLELMLKELTDKFAKSLTVMQGLEVRRRENSIECLSAVNTADPSAVFTALKQPVPSKEEEQEQEQEQELEVSDDDLNEETQPYESLASARAAEWRAEAEAGEQVVVESGGAEEEEEEEEEEVEVEAEVEVEEAEVEAEVEGEVEEAEVEEDEESIEYLEVIYKGVTYYRTEADNLVYSLDEDGEVSDEPIGVWSTEKNKLLKYPTQ